MIPNEREFEPLLANQSPEAFLTYGVHLFLRLMEDEYMGKIWRILTMEPYRDPRAGEIVVDIIYNKTLTFLESVFKKMMALNYIRQMDPAILASEYQYAVFGMGPEYLMLKFQGKETKKVEEKLETHIRFFVSSIAINEEPTKVRE